MERQSRLEEIPKMIATEKKSKKTDIFCSDMLVHR